MSLKIERLAKLRNSNGKINALAIDQRGSLKKMLSKAMGKDASDQDVITYKNIVVGELSPFASGVLLDPEYGLSALEKKADSCGVLLAYEKSGYDVATKGRLPDLLTEWSVAKLRDVGADAIKLLVYYDAFDDEQVNKTKKQFIQEVGRECTAEQMPFFLEIVSYSDVIGDEKSLAFAKEKPKHVQAYMNEFSKTEYAVDVLKVEFPVNMKFVGDSESSAYSMEQAMHVLREAATWTQLPFIYLSAGVTFEVFEQSLQMANDSGVKYDGVLCGRATWQEGVDVFGQQGKEALVTWLQDEGKRRVQRLNELLLA